MRKSHKIVGVDLAGSPKRKTGIFIEYSEAHSGKVFDGGKIVEKSKGRKVEKAKKRKG